VDKIALRVRQKWGAPSKGDGAESQETFSGTRRQIPFIIFEDADLDSAVEGLVDAFVQPGQVCCAGSRLLMQESVADILIGKIQNRMNTLRIGPPLDKAIDIARSSRACRWSASSGSWIKASRKAHLLAAVYPHAFAGCIFCRRCSAMCTRLRCCAAGDFRPVLAAMTFRTPREAVELANNTSTAWRRASGARASTFRCTSQHSSKAAWSG